MKKYDSKNRKNKLTALFLLSLAVGISGCSSTTPNLGVTGGSDSDVSGADSASNTDASGGYWYTSFLNEYKSKIVDNRVDISECRSNYQSDVEKAKNTEYKRIILDDCEFKDFPDCENVYMMTSDVIDISVEEGINMVKAWLEEVGAENFDLEKNLFDVSGDLEKENDEYPLVYEHLDELKRGTFFNISTYDYHIQLGGDGIYSMSDGTLNRYVSTETVAGADAFGSNSEDVVLEGRVEDLKDEGYELLDGYLTVGEGAEAAKKYFMNGTPNVADGIDMEADYVEVFSAKDKYGYQFAMKRIYKGVPISWWFLGTYNSTVKPAEDYTNAIVVTKDTVSAFVGDNASDNFNEQIAEDKIIDISTMLEIAEEKVARNLNFEVHSISLEYFRLGWDDDSSRGETYTMPCWRLWGINRVNNEYVRMYVDALTGDVYVISSKEKNSIE